MLVMQRAEAARARLISLPASFPFLGFEWKVFCMLPSTHSLLFPSVCKRSQPPRFLRFSLWLLALLTVCSPVGRLGAQTSTGEMSVTVLDASGAVVPHASVVIAGTETGNT